MMDSVGRHVRLVDAGDPRVATVLLDRPERANAIDRRFVDDLDEVSATLEDRVAAGIVDVVVLRAAGRHFCVGGDLDEFPADPEVAEPHIRSMADTAHRGIARLQALSVPVVAAVHGSVAGAGIGLVLLSDVAVAGTGSSFVPAYAAVGLVPDGGVGWLLTRAVGRRRAVEILLTGARLDARTAAELGLVSQVVPDDDLDAEVADVVSRLLSVPGDVLRRTKSLVRDAATADFAAHLDAEAAAIAHFAASAPARTRIAAHRARRQPRPTTDPSKVTP